MAALTQEQLDKLTKWTEAQRTAAYWKEEEMKLRKEIFDELFPAPVEGVNRAELPAGWRLKATHKITRNLDQAALPSVLDELRQNNISPDALVKWNPELSISNYKKLTDAGRAIMDQALTIKPGSPTLEFEAPKETQNVQPQN